MVSLTQKEREMTFEEAIAYLQKIWDENYNDDIIIVRTAYGPENYFNMALIIITVYVRRNY